MSRKPFSHFESRLQELDTFFAENGRLPTTTKSNEAALASWYMAQRSTALGLRLDCTWPAERAAAVENSPAWEYVMSVYQPRAPEKIRLIEARVSPSVPAPRIPVATRVDSSMSDILNQLEERLIDLEAEREALAAAQAALKKVRPLRAVTQAPANPAPDARGVHGRVKQRVSDWLAPRAPESTKYESAPAEGRSDVRD